MVCAARDEGGNVGILGAGWLGSALAIHLLDQGWGVRASSRGRPSVELRAAGAVPFEVDLPGKVPISFLEGLDHLVITLPPGGRRHKGAATARYLDQLAGLAGALVDHPGIHLLYCSSTSVYGRAEGAIDETAPVRPATDSARAVVAAEEFLSALANRLTVVRLAGLVGPGRHPGKFYGGRGASIVDSEAPVNLVHQADAVTAISLLLQKENTFSTYNVCAAAHPRKGEFYAAAAEAIGLAVTDSLPGGINSKNIASNRLRSDGWRPIYDDLRVFLPPWRYLR